MNEERTIGLEIECHATVDEHRIADRLRQYFADNMIPHDVVVPGRYGHDTDQDNFTTWKIKPDASVMTLNSQMGRQFPHNMEIVSPILKGVEGMKAIKVVCNALDDGTGTPFATASRTCGLHVHHGMAGETIDNIRNVVNAYRKDEQFFFFALPDSRLSNTYCRPWSDYSTRKCRSSENPFEWYQDQLGRRSSLNFNSYMLRNTLEFRMHSGTVEWAKISSWILLTQRWIDIATKGGVLLNRGKKFQDFVDSIKRTSFEVHNAVAQQVPTTTNENNTTGEYYEQQFLRSSRSLVAHNSFKEKFVHPEAKKQRLPKSSIKTGSIVRMLLSQWCTKKDLVRMLDREFGRLASGKQLKLVSGQLTNLKNLKWGFGFNIVKQGKHFRLFPLGMASVPDGYDSPAAPPVTEVDPLAQGSSDPVTVEMEVLTDTQLDALRFFIHRAQMFEGRRNPDNLGALGANEGTEEQQEYSGGRNVLEDDLFDN